MDRLKIALVGVGNRGRGTYLPIIQTLKDDLELVAVCDGREDVVAEVGEQAGVPAFTNVAEMVLGAKPERLAKCLRCSSPQAPRLRHRA